MLNRTEIERQISDYAYLGKQIKALEEKRKALRDTLVATYFGEHKIYRDTNECVLATYDEKSREGVKGANLKAALPEVYEQFSYTTSWFELRVK